MLLRPFLTIDLALESTVRTKNIHASSEKLPPAIVLFLFGTQYICENYC